MNISKHIISQNLDQHKSKHTHADGDIDKTYAILSKYIDVYLCLLLYVCVIQREHRAGNM